GLVGTDFAPQRMATEDFSESEGRDVAERRRENNVTNKAVGIGRVGEKSEMTEHPADVNEADNSERHPLQFAARAITQNGNQQDQRDCEDGPGDKKAIPAGASFFAARMRNQRRDSDSDDSGVNGTGHPPVAIQSRGA